MKTSFKHQVVYLRHGFGKIFICPEVHAIFDRYRQIAPNATEAGGVLMGRFINDSPHIVVDHVSEPLIGDIRRRTYFYRTQVPHQIFVEKKWLESEATCTYLGEWHTHPEDDPTPSSIDLSGWRKKLRQNPNQRNTLIFIIVGRWRFRAWEGTLADRKIQIEEIFPNQIQ